MWGTIQASTRLQPFIEQKSRSRFCENLSSELVTFFARNPGHPFWPRRGRLFGFFHPDEENQRPKYVTAVFRRLQHPSNFGPNLAFRPFLSPLESRSRALRFSFFIPLFLSYVLPSVLLGFFMHTRRP